MKLMAVIVILLLAGCASTSKVDDIEKQLQSGQQTITALDSKINQLEQDKQALQQQLQFLDGENQSEAVGIRDKIATIDQSIQSYKTEIAKINTFITNNSTQIKSVQQQQSKQRAALAEAIRKNQQLKQQAEAEIQAVERDYEERRSQSQNPDNPN